MLRAARFSLLLLLLFLISPAISISGDEGALEESQQRVIEEFVMGFIDEAIEPSTSSAESDELLKEALSYADTYSMIKGDNTLYKKIQHDIITLPSFSGNEGIFKELQETMLHGSRLSVNPAIRKVKQKVEEFVEALIEKALEPDISSIKRDELLEAATSFAEIYGRKTGDYIFNQRTRQLILNLPPASISRDEEIVREFHKAMLLDNRFVMEFLVKKVEPRIEPFVMEIIAKARKPGTPAAEKDMLLITAMNFAKTFGNMKGDHAFHRTIHRETFTARLTEPVEGVHIIDAPKASETVKNVFRPDNIVIRAGESVSWVNHDDITHVIGTLDFLSDGHFFAPDIGPFVTFENTFLLPGEYYYICFIHSSMIGKITVEE
jgi:plastocyanin